MKWRFSPDHPGWMTATAWLTAIFLTGNFFRANAYAPMRPEALALVVAVGLAGTAIGLACRAIRAPYGFYALAAIGVLDATTGFLGAVRDAGSGVGGPWAGRALAAGVVLGSWILARFAREFFPRVFLIALAAATLSGWGIDGLHPHRLFRASPDSVISGRSDAPNVFFFLLDEHAGFDVFPASVREARKDFAPQRDALMDRGFDIYTHATSHYSSTWDSIPSYLNAEVLPESRRPHLKSKSLTLNRMFAHWKSKGYGIRVYQSTHLNVCSASGAEADACWTYDSSSAGYLQSTSLGVGQKFRVLTGLFVGAQKSRLLHKLWDRWVPAPNFRNVMTGGLAADAALERLKKDLETHPSGTFFFIHWMLPHSSYLFDDACRLTDPQGWVSSVEDDVDASGRVNGEEGRLQKYRAYAGQVVCAQSKLAGLWDWMREKGLWESSQVVLAGDHGSRIFEWNPHEKNLPRLACTDYQDAYRAFLAVKPAGRGTGGAERPEPVTVAARTAEVLGFGPLRGVPEDGGIRVLLQRDAPNAFLPVPYRSCDDA